MGDTRSCPASAVRGATEHEVLSVREIARAYDCPSTVPFLGENRAEMVQSKRQLSAVQVRIG